MEFKGKPTAGELESLRAEKAGEILSFFQVEKREREYYYGDLECGEVRDILDHLFEYDPEARWSAEQLLQSPFLSEFRDKDKEKVADGCICLELNDNRKYKL
jgi:serine/threonine protein kinase